MEKVSVVKCDSYEQKEIDEAIEKVLKDINFDVKPNSKILIKPNILAPNTPEQHSITHYSLIDFLCRYFLRKKCSVTIGESSAFYIKGYTKRAYHTSKIYDVAMKYSVPMVEFEYEKIVPVRNKKMKFLDVLYMPEMVNDFDLIVDVPKIKTHMLMRLSGALKNLYGILPGGYKQILHKKTSDINDTANIFFDLYESLKPKILSVADAVIGLDGGPAAVVGKPKKIGYILASTNPIALDVIACQMIGYSPKDLPTITMAVKRGLVKINDVKQIGKFNPVKFDRLKKGPIRKKKKDSVFIRKTHAFPKANRKCIFCGNCVSYCPVHAIRLENHKWILDKEKCISCYSCVPVCPVNAIELKQNNTNKFIDFLRNLIGA